MIRLVISICLVLFLIGCKTSSSERAVSSADSVTLVVPGPETVDKKELKILNTRLSDLFEQKLVGHNFNGAVLVAKGGHIVYEKYSGFSDPRSKHDPITDSSAFHLASTSKPFTAVAVLKLIAAGQMGLMDDLTRYFPAFPYPGVTVRDLLSHRSGLPNYLYFMEDKEKWPAGKMVSNNDVLDFLIKYRPSLSYTTGTRFNYCNTNYVLLALIIEKVTGVPYPQYLKNVIFKPLGMQHTFVYTPADSGHVMMSYKPSGALWEHDIFDNTYGDKNIYSTTRDMLQWDRGLYSGDFIRQSLLDSAFQPLSNESRSVHNYGLGWRMLNLANGKKVIYHNGKWHGFNPAFARLIDEKAVIIVLGNQYNSNIYRVAKLAYDVFGDYMQDTYESE